MGTSGVVTFADYLSRNAERLTRLGVDHLRIVLIALLIGTVVGVGLGLLTYQRRRARELVLQGTGLILTVPSFALFSLLLGVTGRLGDVTVITGLVLYSLLPVVRNTVTGLLAVDPAIVESAKGVGMGRARRLMRIELPLAWPIVMAGIRVSSALLVGIAALGALVGGSGYGTLLFSGLRIIGSPNAINLALAGTLGVVLLVVVLDLVLQGLTRVTTSRGIR